MIHFSKPRIPTHRRGQKFDLFDTEIVIPETCLADKIWNYLWKERRISTYYLCVVFSQHTPKNINRACRQLIEEERAYLTPAGKYLCVECREPPDWFQRSWYREPKFDR